MKECWSEGELRAYCDRELPAEAQARVTAHLQACPECDQRHRELAGRAGRVMDWVQALPEPAGGRPFVCPTPRPTPRRWPLLVGTLAAGLAVGALLLPERVDAPPSIAPPLAQVVASAAVESVEPPVPA